MRKTLVALAFVSVAVPSAAETVKDGVDAWGRGDHAGAVAIWRPLAEKGDADAAFDLGEAYRLGKGVPLDLTQSMSWLERAARKGHVDAQANLGLLLFQNGNRAAGMRWLTGAADAGEPRAMLIVGTALYNGDGVAADPIKAYAYVSRSAAKGLAPAKATLADLDQVMPIEQRRQGVALAQKMASGRSSAPPPIASSKTKVVPVKSPPATIPPTAKLQPAPAIAAPKPASTVGAWRVQLGAFSQRTSAEGLFAKLSNKLGGVQGYYVPAGKVIRLQAGPFATRAAAASACSRVAPTPCFPVEAR